MFGSSLADVFSAPAYDCRVVGSDQKPEFAVTRLRCVLGMFSSLEVQVLRPT
jgi:hypothetical protein